MFKISEENPDGNKIAKGLASVFTPGIIAELTDEDKTLLKLKRARIANDYNAFKKVDPSFAQFYNISLVSEEGLLLIDNRIAIPEGLRKPILNHLHRGHPGHEKMIDAAMYVWWPRIHRDIINKS